MARSIQATPELMKALPMIALALQIGMRSGLPEELDRELGAVLAAISAGADARKAFRQDARTKPKKNNRESIALVYYYYRAIAGDIGDDSAAINAVRDCEVLKPPTEASSIRKYAQRHRAAMLACLGACARSSNWFAQLTVYSLLHPRGVDVQRDARVRALGEGNQAGLVDLVNAAVPPLRREKVESLIEHLRKKSERIDWK